MEQRWSQRGPVVPRGATVVMGRAGNCSTHRALGAPRDFWGVAVVPSMDIVVATRRELSPNPLTALCKAI